MRRTEREEEETLVEYINAQHCKERNSEGGSSPRVCIASACGLPLLFHSSGFCLQLVLPWSLRGVAQTFGLGMLWTFGLGLQKFSTNY